MSRWSLFPIGLLLGLVLPSAIGAIGSWRTPAAVATPAHPAVSPSGRFMLVVSEGTDGMGPLWQWQVCRAATAPWGVVYGRERLYCGEACSLAHHVLILWDDHDRVWAYSGGQGTAYWVRISDTEWEMHSYGDRAHDWVRPKGVSGGRSFEWIQRDYGRGGPVPAPPVLRRLDPTAHPY